MKAYLVDPFKREVSIVDIAGVTPRGMLNSIYKAIDCRTIDIAYVDADNALYVDDEGLLKPASERQYFLVDGCDDPLAGKALLTSTDDQGNTVAPKMDFETFKAKVHFLDANTVHMLAQFKSHPNWKAAIIKERK